MENVTTSTSERGFPPHVKDLDTLLDSILERPGMHAPTISALESVLWALLSLRGMWRGAADAAKVVYQREKRGLGARGPEIVSERYLTTRPEDDDEAVVFYRSWAEGTRDRQERNEPKA